MSNSTKTPLALGALTSFLLLSCSPHIYYFGDAYPASSSVEVYYDAAQVKKQYKTIGRMTKDLIQSEYDKKHMIELAKKKGADGIIFSDLAMDNERKSTSVIIKAELIKFQ
jgi:hypothetical protein